MVSLHKNVNCYENNLYRAQIIAFEEKKHSIKHPQKQRDRDGQGQEASGEKLLAVHSGIDKKAENEKRFKMAQ